MTPVPLEWSWGNSLFVLGSLFLVLWRARCRQRIHEGPPTATKTRLKERRIKHEAARARSGLSADGARPVARGPAGEDRGLLAAGEA
jgi:hypothetical protein